MDDYKPWEIPRDEIYYNGTWIKISEYRKIKKAERMVMCKWR